jgi:hypothetical protein
VRLSRDRVFASILGAGCVAWIAWAFRRTDRVAEIVGTDPAEVRALAIRDIGSAISLLTPGAAKPAIAVRVMYDLSDAWRYGRNRPKVLASTVGFAALGIAGLAPWQWRRS